MRMAETAEKLKFLFPDFLVLVQLEEMLVAFGPDAARLADCVSFIRLHHMTDGTAFAGFPVVLSDIVLSELAHANVAWLILNAEQAGDGTE